MTTRSHKNLLFITLSLFSIIGYSYFAFAAAPLGGYNPGDTLNPDCAPGDVDCVVTLPSGGSTYWKYDDAGGDFDQPTYYNDFFGANSPVVIVGTNNIAKSGIILEGTSSVDHGVDILGTTTNPGSAAIHLAGAGTFADITLDAQNGKLYIPGLGAGVGKILTSDANGFATWQTPSGGGSGWSLTGNAGTTAGTNFIGTTDPVDFMVKTNGNQIALFGQNGNITLGSEDITEGFPSPISSGTHSFAFGAGSQANGYGSIALGSMNPSYAIMGTRAFGDNSTAIGLNALAQGESSIALGNQTESLANYSFAIGNVVSAYSHSEIAMGTFNTLYTPVSIGSFSVADRLFSIGNGYGAGHNAYTLWKDGSFAYNDDNFQNDSGIEQNMFYFNYGNHDGNGGVNTKRAIRLGSINNDLWDINNSSVGDSSIAIGFGGIFGPGAVASGISSLAFGQLTEASGDYSTVFGRENVASGNGATAFGIGSTAAGEISTAFGNSTQASGDYSTAFGSSGQALGTVSTTFGNQTFASGNSSTAFGDHSLARSFGETAFGIWGTDYMASDVVGFVDTDRLLTIGNGTTNGSESDALTILKSGQTGIGIDNFETYTNGNIFQVGDGSTGIIGYVDNGTGNWVAVSDERKKDNITDITYGLDQIIQLRPTSFNYKRNNEHTIGFLAQQVLPIIPEAVYGTESEGYGMSYATLTPVIVKAIQEMNIKITDIGNTETPNTWRDSIIAWFESATNGIRKLFVGEVHTDMLCVGQTCVTESQLQQLLQNNQQTIIPSSGGNLSTDPDPVAISDTTPLTDPDPGVISNDPGDSSSDTLTGDIPTE